MTDNKAKQNSAPKSYLVSVGGRTEVWDEATYTELKDALYNKYPDANMFEMDNMTDFSAVDDEMQYVVNTGERTETWDAATMKELGSALKKKYPNATVKSLKYKDYWYDKALADEEKLNAMKPQLDSLEEQLSMPRYRDASKPDSLQLKYDEMKSEYDALQSAYDSNPRVVAYKAEMAAAQAEAQKNLPNELRRQIGAGMSRFADEYKWIKSQLDYEGYSVNSSVPMPEHLKALGGNDDEYVPKSPEELLKELKDRRNEDIAEKTERKIAIPEPKRERRDATRVEFRPSVGGEAVGYYNAATEFLDAYDYLTNNKSSVAQGVWYNWYESVSSEANDKVHEVLKKLEAKCGNLNEVTPEDIEKNLGGAEKTLLQSYFLLMEEEAKTSKAFRGGEIAGESGKIAAEVIVYDIALNTLLPGAGTAAHVASSASKATKVASAVSKWYNFGSKLTKLGKGVVKLTGATAKLGLKATGFTALAPTTYSHIAKKKLTIGDDGKLKDSDEDIMRYFAEDVVENFTELSGEGVLKLFGKAGDLAKGTRIGAKIADRMDSSWFGKAGKWLATNSGTKWFKRAGFHGLPVEVFEEFEGAVINQFTGLDENAISNFADKDNLTTMMIGFAPMTLLGMGTGIGSYAYASHSVNKNAENLSKVLLDNGYNEEQVKHLLNYERQMSPESLGKEINNVLAVMEQNGASAEAKKAVTDYAVAVGRYKALEGSFEAQQPTLKNKKLKELNSKYGTFYQTKNDGKNKLDEVTTTYVLPQGETKGRDVFIVSEKNENGQYDAIDVNTGERLKVSDSEIALLRSEDMSPVFTTRSLDTYLTERVMEERQKTLSDYEAAYENGQEMTVADLSSLNEQEQQAKDNLLNTGITSRENSFTEDSINLSSSELLSLSEQDDFTEEESNAIRELAIAKRTNEGLIDKLKQPIISSIDSRNSIASNASNNGTLTVGTHNGKTVYVKGGVQTSNGSIVKPDNAKGYPVEIVDAATGEVSVVDSKEVTNAGNVNTATWNRSYEVGMIKAFEQKIEELRNAKSPNAILSEVYDLVGKKVYLNINDNIILVEVDQILPSMEVLIKGKKGDLGGKSVLAVGIDEFYNMIYRDANGNPVLPKEEQDESDAPDYRGETVSILINGVPASVEVISQDNSSDSIVYEYTDENGNIRRGSSTISGFEQAIKQANEYVPEQPNVPEETPVAETSEQPIEEAPSEEVATEEPVEAPVENIPLDPESINWDALFEQDKEAYFVEMQNQFGEEAVDVLNEEIDAAQSELDALGKAKTKSQNDRIKNRNKKKALQSRIDALNEMVARLTTTPESKIITEPTQEAPVKTIAFGASVNNEDRLEIPKKPVIKRPRTIKGMSSLDPKNSTELAARELGLKNGGIKLTKESFLHHTGYGTSEANALKGLFLSKDKGGKTVEEAGERLMEIDREYDLGLLDQNDPNAGTNAILEALSENSTMGELRSYIARQRQAEAQREADAIYAYEMEQYEKLLDDAIRDDVFAEELKAGKAYTEDEYNELMTILAEEINDYDTGNQGEIDILYETEDIGDLPAAEGEAYGGIERSNQVLQETQSVQTSGERDSQRRGANQNIIGEDASSPVHNGESSDNERGSSEEEFVSSLDEDMPDFIQESERVPIAPNPVADPVSEAKNREERLLSLIERKGVSDALKRDSAFNAGKEVADFFATYAEFEEYEAEAKDLGNYYEDFARGVKASFANRPSNESHIGEAGLEVSSEAQELTLDAVLESLDNNIEVEAASDQQAQAMLDVRDELSGVERMTVYHGSPHKFDAFDHSKMGTGEGAQAHGWGTYVAVNRETSVEYAEALRSNAQAKIKRNGLDITSHIRVLPMDAKTPLELIATLIDWHGIDKAKVELELGLKEAETRFKEASPLNYDSREAKVELYKNASVIFNSSTWNVELPPTNLYEVNIPEDHGSNYFYASNPTRIQVEKLYDACKKEGLEYAEVIAGETLLDNRPVGDKIVRNLSKMLGSPRAASEFLSRAGFSGIKYHGNVDGECFVIFNESDAKITSRTEFYQTPNGTVYGWTDGKKIYLTKAGFNPNTPIHEYTHLWAKAMMQKNPKGWNSVKSLLKGTPIWNEVINDPNYSDIKNNEDAVASEALSRLSGSQNADKMEQMAQQMIDEAKGTMRKAKARGLIQNMKDALAKFWNWVGTNLFGIEKFDSVEQVTDRVLWDLINKTDLQLDTLSESQVETQIVTDPKVIAELEASPKTKGFRNVVQNENGTFSSPMAYWLQSTTEGAKSRIETAKFELGKWEEAEEHPELVDDSGHVTLVKPNKKTVSPVAYDPYIHNRLEPVNLQFKEAWKRSDLVYVETEVANTDLESGYHADKAKLPVGIHSWSNGAVMLSKYDKPMRVMPWDEVADAWAKRLNGKGVEFDVVPAEMRPLLVERGVEILPPHKNAGKDCNDAYKKWKNANSENNSVSLSNVSQAIESGAWNDAALNELNKITEDVEEGKAILKRYTSSELTGLLEGGRLLVGASIISRGSERNVSASRGRAKSLEEKAAETIPAITAWAKSIGAWRDYSERSEEEIAHSYWTSGGEAQVFYLGNGKVEKIIGLDYFVDPQLAFDRIAIHNSLFEETQLKVTGFGTNKDGKFAIIVEQPTIIGKHTDNSEIDSYIESIGFKKIDDATRTFANEELYLSDLHEENVLNQNHERYYVIDGDFRLNTPEVGIGGTRQIDDRIVRDDSDNGNVIQRSDRLNSENPDIRFRKGENNTKFVEQFEFKQNNEKQELEYSDEFRRLQEESARMSGQLVSEKDGVQQAAIRGLVGGIGRTLQRELDRATSGRGNKLRTVVNDSKGTSFDIIENVDGRLFHDIFEVVRTYLPNGELVDLHDNYDDAICYITSDGLAGFAVDKDGNLISVYSLYGKSKKGFLGAIKDLITEAGATHLDGYNSEKQPLAEIYSKVFGWKVASMMDYNMEYDHDNIAENHGMPQVAFMVNTEAEIETKHFDKDQYDEAVAYQQEQVEVSQRIDAQNAAIDYLAGDARTAAMEHAVNKEASKLGVTVTYKTRSEMPKGHENDKGYYNTKTGEIVICTENNASIADAIQTILHEAVAHKGLRQLIGDRFNEFINRVYNSLDAETKAKVDALAEKHYNSDKMVAMEEYMASLAENENFAETSVWEKIKSIFESIINSILGRNDIKIGDKELRYILRASYNNMANPNTMNTIEGWAKDTNMRNELGINEATPEIMSRTGIDPTDVAMESAKQVYDNQVERDWQEWQREFQDEMQPVRIAIDAIQQETGNIPIEDYENFLLIQNQNPSRSSVEIYNFERKYYEPIIEQVNKIIDRILEARGLKNNKKNRAEVYAEVRQYMIAKHGLERNKYYQSTKTRKLTEEEKKTERKKILQRYMDEINMINADTILSEEEKESKLRDADSRYEKDYDEVDTKEAPDMRDYAGLTSLFGFDSTEYEQAEEEAARVVEEFEAELGKTENQESQDINDLWKRINAATDKTLRHSYESGMISRQQYDQIRSMFNFYIPLRGFDETTAEDVYSYARFEGNRFNAAVHKAEGRTSVADDPIATIMNMAESEIAQGNKNRAKQALYYFIINRPVVGENGVETQNSLMQVEDVWYVKTVDENGEEVYQIASPKGGETWEEFEDRMGAFAEEEKAFKSAKGKVDVGMRFQKPSHEGSHYVYLKINGVDKAIYINGNPKAAYAINGTTKKHDDSVMRKAGRVISPLLTNYSLPFAVGNYSRDMIYSYVNVFIKEKDPTYRVKFFMNRARNNFATMMVMLHQYRSGKFDSKEDLNSHQRAFIEFMENGGQTGYVFMNSIEMKKKELERTIERAKKGLRKGGIKNTVAFKLLFSWVELINESIELVSRFAAFKAARDTGHGIVAAVSKAKEITVNFNTKGAQDGNGWIGAAAKFLGSSKFFFNASVQGTQNMKSMFDANKLKFCTIAAGFAGVGFLMPFIISSVASLFGNDDDDEYWSIPEYERQSNICIPVGGGGYIKIPLPVGFREMWAIGDMTAAIMSDKKFARDETHIAMEYANKLAAMWIPQNPIEGSANGLGVVESAVNLITPSVIQPLTQIITNKDFKGDPLQRERDYNKYDPQWTKAFNNNPEWLKGLCKWLNENVPTDIGGYKFLDLSPENIDNVLSGYLGGTYNLIKGTAYVIEKEMNGEDVELSRYPVIGRVWGTGADSDERIVNEEYHKMKEYYNERIGRIERVAGTFGYDLKDVFVDHDGDYHPKMHEEIYGMGDFNWMKTWYLGHEGNRKASSKAEKLGLNQLKQDIKDLQKSIAEREERGMSTEKKQQKLIEKQKMFDEYYRDFTYRLLEMD